MDSHRERILFRLKWKPNRDRTLGYASEYLLSRPNQGSAFGDHRPSQQVGPASMPRGRSSGVSVKERELRLNGTRVISNKNYNQRM